jgi:glycosyltransferase involved in cell wall biosynthesis
MKKILHIPNYYPPHTGGIEYVCYQIVSNLNNFTHSVICFNDNNTMMVEDYEGVRIVRCGILKKIAGQALSFTYFQQLRREIRQFKPDIIHFHAPNPLVSIFLMLLIPRRTKLVVHFHGEILSSRLLYFCYKLFEWMFFRRADKIITTSPVFKNEVKVLVPFREKCTVIENAIPTIDLDLAPNDTIHITTLKAKYNNRKIVLSFGRHTPYKGLKYLIEAEQYIEEECEIIIGGTGPLTEELKRMTHSPRVHFIGRIPDNELKYYLHAAHVFAFPSHNKAEAFGLTLLQSMYCHTPPVTFTIAQSGVNYVNLNNFTGLEVENGNVHKFAKAIDTLLANESLHQTLAENAHKRVLEHFTIDRFKFKVTMLYNELDIKKNE